MDELTVTQAKEFLDKEGYVFIDVRSDEEWEMIHLNQALHISMHDQEFPTKIKKLAKHKQYLVFCKSGERSYHAAQFMEEQGFKVSNVNGWMFS
jgi:rhodanese-related sulfurtransferase